MDFVGVTDLTAFDVGGEEGGVAGVPGDLRLHQLRQIRRRRVRRRRRRRRRRARDPGRLAAGRAAAAAARDPRVDAVQILHQYPRARR
jgi:hypothetical protein